MLLAPKHVFNEDAWLLFRVACNKARLGSCSRGVVSCDMLSLHCIDAQSLHRVFKLSFGEQQAAAAAQNTAARPRNSAP